MAQRRLGEIGNGAYVQVICAALSASSVVGCSSGQGATTPTVVGGAYTAGGAGHSGGSSTASAVGSSSGVGGHTATTSSGGVAPSGGTAASSSNTVSAGGNAVGGSSTQSSAIGGNTAVAGSKNTGGKSSAGGVTSAGGSTQSSKTGGATSAGGTAALGGTRATGGTTATVASSVLGGTGTMGGSTSTSTSVSSSADKPSTDTTWSQDLTAGVNGPVPLIVVDQFGYRTGTQKIAVIRDPQTGYDSAVSFTPGTHYSVVNKATGTAVKQGAPTAWNGGATDSSSGDKAWWFDFSDITTPGTYTVVDVDKNARSVEFDIDDNIYRSVLKHAVRMYYYQRAGFAKSAVTAGSDWADGASHLGAGQDSQAHAWTAKTDATLVKDLHGGWFDAGDYNKYTAWGTGTVIALLHAYQETPRRLATTTALPNPATASQIFSTK